MPNVFIYGSCVSRDTMNYLDRDWKVADYVARQSMISAANGPASVIGKSVLTSDFQNRSIQGDIEGTAIEQIRDRAPQADLVLVDIVDERRGVYELGPGEYVTFTWDLESSTLLKQQDRSLRHIQFGTDEHFELWKPAAEKVVAAIHDTGTPAIALTPPWGNVSSKGKHLTYRAQPVTVINASYSRYNAFLDSLGIPAVTLDESDVTANEEHVWGLEPYHFVDDVYHKLRDSIYSMTDHSG